MNNNIAVANSIIDKIFEEAQRVKNMNITDAKEIGIASVLTGLTAFFVAGYRNDFDLCQELTPAFQKRIMPSVTKEEYDNYSYMLNNSYVKFREVGIKHQGQSDNWVTEMMEEFGEQLLSMLRANSSDYSKKLMTDEANRLKDIAIKTGADAISVDGKADLHGSRNKEEKTIDKVKTFIIPALFVAVVLLFIHIETAHYTYIPREATYYMQEAHEEDDGYTEYYIRIEPGDKESEDEYLGTFSIYIMDYADSSREYMPQYSLKAAAPCGYWKWKKIIGRFATNNEGKKYAIVPSGYTRVDCYIADGESVGINGFGQSVDTSDFEVSATRDIIDFGTNNLIYGGTIYNEVNLNVLNGTTSNIMNTLDELMDDKE